jgi:hypothetical protein
MTLEQSPLCYDYHLQTFPLLSVSRCHDSVDFCPHLLPPPQPHPVSLVRERCSMRCRTWAFFPSQGRTYIGESGSLWSFLISISTGLMA